MKKFYLFLTIFISFSFISCSSLRRGKSEVIVKENEHGSKIPIPKLDNIDLYIRESYDKVTWDKVRREAYVNEAAHLDIRTKDLILDGQVRIGMYKEDVFASLGAPDKKIKKYTDFGIKEEWIYTNYIYIFENGILKEFNKIK